MIRRLAAMPAVIALLVVPAGCDWGDDQQPAQPVQQCQPVAASSGTPAPTPSTDEPRGVRECEVPLS
jgi:hypothetical protein